MQGLYVVLLGLSVLDLGMVMVLINWLVAPSKTPMKILASLCAALELQSRYCLIVTWYLEVFAVDPAPIYEYCIQPPFR